MVETEEDNIWGSAEVRDLASPLYKGSSQEEQMVEKQHVIDFRILNFFSGHCTI